MKTGSCLCGAVKYEFDEPARAIIVCHCVQCRKQTGSMMHATAVTIDKFRLMEQRGLKWYRASDAAERGFCGECGSVLFWKPDSGDRMSFTAGSIDGNTDLEIEGHIYCDFKADYFNVPQDEGYTKGEWEK
jgi:hypothetical protein